MSTAPLKRCSCVSLLRYASTALAASRGFRLPRARRCGRLAGGGIDKLPACCVPLARYRCHGRWRAATRVSAHPGAEPTPNESKEVPRPQYMPRIDHGGVSAPRLGAYDEGCVVL